MLNSHIIIDNNGWGKRWFIGDDSRPPQDAVRVPDALRMQDATTIDPETGEDVTVQTLVDSRLLKVVDGTLTLQTQADRDAYDTQCVIDAIPQLIKAEANQLLLLMTRIVTESAEAGVTLDISASNTTAELIDTIDNSSLTMTRKGYYASLLLSRWKRYHDECGGTWEQLKMGPFA